MSEARQQILNFSREKKGERQRRLLNMWLSGFHFFSAHWKMDQHTKQSRTMKDEAAGKAFWVDAGTAMIIVQCNGKFIARKKLDCRLYMCWGRKKPFSICSGNYQRDWKLWSTSKGFSSTTFDNNTKRVSGAFNGNTFWTLYGDFVCGAKLFDLSLFVRLAEGFKFVFASRHDNYGARYGNQALRAAYKAFMIAANAQQPRWDVDASRAITADTNYNST